MANPSTAISMIVSLSEVLIMEISDAPLEFSSNGNQFSAYTIVIRNMRDNRKIDFMVFSL